MAQLDQELVRTTALQVVFDLLLKFGLEAFKVNASVHEKGDDPPSSDSEQDKSDNENDENEGGEDVTEKNDDEDVEETEARDTDTAASVLTILTGILESEVNFPILYAVVFCLKRSSFNLHLFVYGFSFLSSLVISFPSKHNHIFDLHVYCIS